MKRQEFIEIMLEQIPILANEVPSYFEFYADAEQQSIFRQVKDLSYLCEQYIADEQDHPAGDEPNIIDEKMKQVNDSFDRMMGNPMETPLMANVSLNHLLSEGKLNPAYGPAKDTCAGTNCNAIKGNDDHSAECMAEHDEVTHHLGVRGKTAFTVIHDEIAESEEPAEKKYDGGKADIGRMKRQFADALSAVALSGMYGAVKYEDPNGCSYKEVSNAKDRYDSAGSRHDLAYAGGEMYASDSHLHHLGAKAWNALAQLQLAIEEGEEMIDPDPFWQDNYYQDWERQRDELKLNNPTPPARKPARKIINRHDDYVDAFGMIPNEDLIALVEKAAFLESHPNCQNCQAYEDGTCDGNNCD